jgi:NhaP-type Na+/H+ or K+/H+ antiporter
MYQNAAVLAVFLLLYSAIARRVDKSWVSGPIVFTGAGLVLGPTGLGALHLDIAAEGLHLLAEATLAMVLFTDAAKADLGVVRRNLQLSERLLLLGLPLSILLGLAVAWLVCPGLNVLELACNDAGADGCGARQAGGHEPDGSRGDARIVERGERAQ